LREQVIPQRVGNRSGVPAKGGTAGVVQRPVRRARPGSRRTLGAKVRSPLRYTPLVLKVALAIAFGVMLFTAYRAAASASFFQMRNVDINGTSRASAEEIQALVRREAGKTGVWEADLAALSGRIQRVPWVRTAVVSRVLPDGIRVRITERLPLAVVRMSSGHFYWVDEDAVLLDEMSPTDQQPAFFLRGWSEDGSEAASRENRERVQGYRELVRQWNAAGLSERVSEVNLIDMHDVRAQLAGDDSQIEVRLGSQDLGKRLKQALEVLDEQRQTARGPLISYIDLAQGKRAIIGFTSGAHAFGGSNFVTGSSPAETANRGTAGRPNRALARNAKEEPTKKDRGRRDSQKVRSGKERE
jgi:cell division septal protein FtsQ